MDLLLSSGYLAFARHLGVLRALQARGFEPEAVVGTSSGAVVGALYAAGMPVDDIVRFVTRAPPAQGCRLNHRPWRGLLSLAPMARILSGVLPASFEELEMTFAVGVTDAAGRHRLLSEGPLVPAVLASSAVPWLFEAYPVEGALYADGGATDRVGVAAWRNWRPARRAVAHIVDRSRGAVTDIDPSGLVVVRSARSRASLRSWGDFETQLREAESDAERLLRERAMPW